MTQTITPQAVTPVTNGLDPVSELVTISNLAAQINNTTGALTISTNNTNGAATLTASQLLSGICLYNPAGNVSANFTNTTDTAANICATFSSLTGLSNANMATAAVRTRIINSNSNGIMQLAAGSGVTLTTAGNNTTNSNNINSNNWKDFLITFGNNGNACTLTNIGSGTFTA